MVTAAGITLADPGGDVGDVVGVGPVAPPLNAVNMLLSVSSAEGGAAGPLDVAPGVVLGGCCAGGAVGGELC